MLSLWCTRWLRSAACEHRRSALIKMRGKISGDRLFTPPRLIRERRPASSLCPVLSPSFWAPAAAAGTMCLNPSEDLYLNMNLSVTWPQRSLGITTPPAPVLVIPCCLCSQLRSLPVCYNSVQSICDHKPRSEGHGTKTNKQGVGTWICFLTLLLLSAIRVFFAKAAAQESITRPSPRGRPVNR